MYFDNIHVIKSIGPAMENIHSLRTSGETESGFYDRDLAWPPGLRNIVMDAFIQ